jgi:hypothetical protein
LEALFRSPLSTASHQQVAGLTQNKGTVCEDFDLDFKSAPYANSEKGRRDLATDVAAMANTAGGVIVLGIVEDDHACADGISHMPISDAEVNRMTQIITTGLAPTPGLDIRLLDDPAQPGTGFFLVIVPRSPNAPHAVLVNGALRYPRRVGRTTAYLSESEIAQAYRDRFAGLQTRLDAAVDHETYLRERLNAEEDIWVVVSLVPDLDGLVTIDSRSFQEFKTRTVGGNPMLIDGASWAQASVGAGRLNAHGGHGDDGRMKYIGCALHRTGAGAFAASVGLRREDQPVTEVVDQYLIAALISGLRFLASHARDRAAAGGSVSLRATIVPLDQDRPAQLSQISGGFHDRLGRQSITTEPVATAVADLDELAGNDAALLAAAHALSTRLVQEFGHPEALQLTQDGKLHLRYWAPRVRSSLQTWAAQMGVELASDTVNV